MGKHENRIVLFAVIVGLALAGSVCADDNVRAVQEKLRDGGFYSGEIDGAYSSQLAAALTRYQVRKGLPVTGQLDVETSDALDAKPAVTKNTVAPEQSSETWRRLRRREPQTTSTGARARSSPQIDRSVPEVGPAENGPVATSVTLEPAVQSAGSPVQSTPAAKMRTSAEITEPASAPPATARISSEAAKPASALPAAARASTETTAPASAPPATTSTDEFSTERLRDYVGAFVLAGLDPHVGSEADFFADRVKYYDQGVIDREQIRNDLQDYAAHWPERRFWFVGNIKIEPPHRKRVRVTFPLRYELRNGATSSSGTINKTLVLESAGDDLQIVEVNETKAE
jgi:peptidoglycan hydrolase-like protein with peptidoglycan-binding domain